MEKISNLYSLSNVITSLDQHLSGYIQTLKIDDLQNCLGRNPPNVLLIDRHFVDDHAKLLDTIIQNNPLTKIISINEDINDQQDYDLLCRGIESITANIFANLEIHEFMSWVFHANYKILIIDDHTIEGLNYEKDLEQSGFNIKTIQSNVEIIEPIKFYQPDLLLVMIDLTEIAGDELVKLIKNIPDNLSLPIFFISSDSPNRIKQKIIDVGACEIFVKPIKHQTIVSKILQKVQSNHFHFIGIQPKINDKKQSYHHIEDKEHDEIISFIADNANNPTASVVWLKINNKTILQKKIGLSGFKNFSDKFISLLPLSNLSFSSIYSITEGIYAFTSNNFPREEIEKWITKIHQWINNHHFTSQDKDFNVTIKPFVLTDVPKKSNKELLFYDAERLLLNSGTSQDTIFISEGDDQKHFYLIKTKLENAIREKCFNWRYQSILSTKNEKLEIFQLLLRVIDKSGKELRTKDYLQVANQTGLLKLLDRFTLEHAIEMIKIGEDKDIQRHILINQLIADYESETYKTHIIKYIRSQNLPKNRLVFQFRQDMVEEHTSLLFELGKELRQANVTLCLSEFDSSKTAWSIAKALNVHWIRVKPFDLESNSLHKSNPEYIGNVIKKAQNLGYKLMIPNIDSAGLTADIWTLNADLIQGNFIQAPVSDLKYIEG